MHILSHQMTTDLLLLLSGNHSSAFPAINRNSREEEFAAVEERYHLTPKCWVLETADALKMLELV